MSTPASVPGEFVIHLGSDGPIPAMWDSAATELLFSWLAWVEVELEGVDDGLIENLYSFRGSLMVAAVLAMKG